MLTRPVNEEDIIRARAVAVADFSSDMTFMIDCGLEAMEEILLTIEKKYPLVDCRQQFVDHLLEQCARLDTRFPRLAK